MKKLWEKTYTQHTIAEAYCFGDTTVLDNALVEYEIMGSLAHASMLSDIGVITREEFQQLKATLLEILSLYEKGVFMVGFGDEDVHTKVENYLVKKLGTLGKKIHTARSRNDQVLVDLRLYTKDECIALAETCLTLAKKFVLFAENYEYVPMPGYTHMQKAMPSSVGMWAGSFAESLLDDMYFLETAYHINDQNPLGSGASYGVSLPIDRNHTTKLLGFSKTQNNSLYSQVSRPKGHLALMSAVTQIMLTLSRFAEDVLLFTTSEFHFFTVPNEMTTGSSIMPQKKNLDVMEILRARTHEVVGFESVVATITSGLPSGYNADFGETKLLFFKSVATAIQSIEVVSLVIDGIRPSVDVLEKSCTPELFATHAAYLLVKKGVPFREAYRKIGLTLNELKPCDAIDVLKSSNHIGGPGNLGLAKVEKQIQKKKKWWTKKKISCEKTMDLLKGGETV